MSLRTKRFIAIITIENDEVYPIDRDVCRGLVGAGSASYDDGSYDVLDTQVFESVGEFLQANLLDGLAGG